MDENQVPPFVAKIWNNKFDLLKLGIWSSIAVISGLGGYRCFKFTFGLPKHIDMVHPITWMTILPTMSTTFLLGSIFSGTCLYTTNRAVKKSRSLYRKT